MKYTAIIIEPRKHKALHFVLDNFLEGLTDDWSIIVFHGTENEIFIKDIIKTFDESYINRIKLINLKVNNLTIKEYNQLLLNTKFYEFIPTETFLIFQTDTLILNKEKINNFLDYDYVGAPWNHKPFNIDVSVGNGGLSLRKKSKMLEILNNIPYQGQPEDLYFCSNKTIKIHKPSFEEAKNFSVEEVFFEKPFGCHKPWNRYHSNGFFNLYPQVKELYNLNV